MTKTEPVVLEVRAAHKRYGDRAALNGAAFALHQGEWLALLGPNGAGKTTLVRTIAGRLKLDQGEILLHGNALQAGDQKQRAKLGIVPQELALYSNLTAVENLEVFGRFHGVSGATLRDKIRWALDWIALSDRAHDHVKGFSGGMKRRLNIAAAVLHQPSVILLDEPTVGVDPQSRERIWQMLNELRADGASLMLTTHQLDEAQTICDRIVIIDGGQTIAAGTLDELIEQTIGSRRGVFCKVKNAEGTVAEEEHTVDDLADALPGILADLKGGDKQLLDLRIQTPSLQAVFLHLTGKDLRE
ncbi:ABC transporter ATP-binding protein [Acanthopleuribacter pedis]|uniref:ABC transporter ATP-binding protein n=1 Tax=Acanthopleuribacter pedis TaxID=442870 RepID=A0A8J7Q8Q6_9BACT|nr:ABC transporter ATP-binding protein [Acanthopleuribacter pedis]MBO1319494.1 ABC transporter ATP-binding protein [Acanthopleuribacter pedis]